MSAIRAVLFVLSDQRWRDFGSGCRASPVPARSATGAGRPGSVRAVRTGMW
jgi:hypothetical protein